MAFLHQISIQGFKSFSPRKITLNLDKGFTAIVGENGCGKSNILDAVCFVLGHLSSKSLRAENFASLLFNGGASQNPAKFCRVSLVFDNRDRQFPIDANEVTFSREVDQSGISAYRIGGKRCTRTELLDTIAVAGLHPEGHNIVMQNELANVIGMSPAEIRQIVEGVAGISVFDEKKRQIEVELEKVDRNLHMVQVRTEEIRHEYTRLERDRNDALRWREITEKLSQLERDLAFAELARVENRLQEMKDEYADYTKKIRNYETQRNECRKRKEELEQSTLDDNAQMKKLERQHRKNEIEVTRLREQLKGLELTSEKISRQRESISKSLEHLRNVKQEEQGNESAIRLKVTKLEDEEAELKDQILPLREKLASISEVISEPDRQYVELREQILTLTEEIEQKKSELGETQALSRVTNQNITELQQQIEQSQDLIPEQEGELQTARSQFDEIQIELQEINEKCKRLKGEQKTIQKTMLDQQSKQDELAQLIQSSKEDLLEAQTRLKTIREFKKFGLTRKAAIKAVMNYVKENKIPGVHGTLGSLGKTSTEYATALEVAGGGRLDFVVVDDEETATKCIKHLKKSRIGRATFIPLNTIKADSPAYKESAKGVEGNAIDLLSFKEKFRPAFEYVFGRTLIVKDLEVARNIDASSYRKISIDGDVVEPHRTLTGGYYKGVSSLKLEEEARIPELQKKIKELRKLHSTAESEYVTWKTKLDRLEEEIGVAQKTSDRLENKSVKALDTVTQREEALRVFKTSINKLQEALKGDKTAKNALEEKQQQTQQEIDELIKQRQKLQKDLSDLERTSLDPNLNRLRNQLDELENNLREIQLKLTERKGEIQYSRAELTRITRDLDGINAEYEQAGHDLDATNSKISSVQNELTKREQTLEKLEEETSVLEEQLETNESEYRQLGQTIDDLIEKISEEKMNRSKLEGRIEHWEERHNIQKEKVKGLEPPPQPVNHSMVLGFRKKMAALEQERSAMGLINQKAVERFEEVRHAYDEILEKERSIRGEREAIVDAMKRAEEEKYRVFMAAFSSISNNFSDVYRQLTNGEGQLELEKPENPFLGGIRMKVRPAGKRVQYLDALSGGEKALTGLTFMFALQLHQPAPFYFLDEIDEALDPNNTDRVARLVEKLSENSQFIIISHNEITIRLAHTLLGVAMVDNVSQVFSVKFEEGLLLIEGKS